MPYVETEDGTSLYYRDWGSGQPIVFLHGWALGSGMWEYQMTPLSSDAFRCIAWDARGCGRSDDPGRGYDFDTLAGDLAALLGKLALGAVTLVAHSMASGIVARYLSKFGPGRIAQVLLLAPTTPFLLKADDNPNGVDRSYFEFMASQLQADRPAFLSAGAASFFGDGAGVSPALMSWATNLALSASPRATIGYVETFSASDLRADMKSFTVPTLVIHGDADASTPIELTGKPTAAAIDGARLVVYEGAAHGLFYTERKRLNRDIAGFIESRAAAAA